MRKKIALAPDITLPRLEEAARGVLTAKQRNRLRAMRLALEGNHTAAEIAADIGISRAQLFAWTRLTLEQLLHPQHGGGRAPRLTDEVQRELSGRFRNGDSPAEIQHWLNSPPLRINIKSYGVSYYIGKLRLSPDTKAQKTTVG